MSGGSSIQRRIGRRRVPSVGHGTRQRQPRGDVADDLPAAGRGAGSSATCVSTVASVCSSTPPSQRWSGKARNWDSVRVVCLNPEYDGDLRSVEPWQGVQRRADGVGGLAMRASSFDHVPFSRHRLYQRQHVDDAP